MIDFNIPLFLPESFGYMQEAVEAHKISGDGLFTKKCSKWLEENTGAAKVLLTTSGTAALEMAAILCDIKAGDEVILPSYTFSSTANAFVLAGAKLVFVDIRPDTMNIDETKIEAAITDRTKVIVPVHYAGVSCEMDSIMDIATRYGLIVVEDAAQAVMSAYKGRPLGTIGDIGCYSFHETKNFSMGEGGAIAANDAGFALRAEVIREKGTNRSQFHRGEVDKYTWIDKGSSYLPSDLNAAYLWGQLEHAQLIQDDRMKSWNRYYEALSPLADDGIIELPFIPKDCVHNAHMFYIKCSDIKTRTEYIAFMHKSGVQCVFHYIPLHTSPAGRKYGRFAGEEIYTTAESERLVRLPLYYGLSDDDLEKVISKTLEFFGQRVSLDGAVV